MVATSGHSSRPARRTIPCTSRRPKCCLVIAASLQISLVVAVVASSIITDPQPEVVLPKEATEGYVPFLFESAFAVRCLEKVRHIVARRCRQQSRPLPQCP